MLSKTTSRRNLNAVLILVFLITLALFLTLSASLDSNWLKEIDEQLSLRVSRSQVGQSDGLFALVTLLGSDYVLGVVLLLAGVLLYRSGKTAELVGIVAVGVGAKVFEHGLKLFFQRARPELVGATTGLYGDYAFPSGHSLNSAAVYGFILVLAGAHVRPTFCRYLIVIAGGLLILVIGLSRVVLKMHWPSDVTAGWLVAGMLLSLVVFTLSMFKGRFNDRISSAKPG